MSNSFFVHYRMNMKLDYFSICLLIFRNNLLGYMQGARDNFYHKHFFSRISITEKLTNLWTVLEKEQNWSILQ